jgi:S-adenosylmethionine:tRNA ribosyltransferase-isomerase
MTDPFFDYDLPSHLIAQQPAAARDQARLLVVRRSDGSLAHHVVADLPELLDPGDLLVFNDTRVLPARLLGRRPRTGGKWEGLFLREHENGLWELLCQTRGRLLEGETIQIEPGPLRLDLVRRGPDGHWLVRPRGAGSAVSFLEAVGHVPLPPYIRRRTGGSSPPVNDRERYQTVFAARPGAVAAPTAGLHFTPELLERLNQRGIGKAFLTLHVGLGTFQPVQVADFRQHSIHSEWGELPLETVEQIAACRRSSHRVVAVGTTSVRVLETIAALGPLRAWSGETNLYIYPPYSFRLVDALLTNFHLPRSTLLLLVSAFAGSELLRRAYRTAIEQQYRFYSYGDAMLIL